MHIHKELQHQNSENKQVWPEQLLRVRVLLILDACNQGMQNYPFFVLDFVSKRNASRL